MKSFKKISLFTALLAFTFCFTFATSYAQDTTDTTEVPEVATYTVQGKVVNAETTEILTDIEVTIAGKDISAMTDQEGKYVLKNLPEGTHTIKVDTEGYKVWEKQVTVDADKELVIELTPNPMQ